MGLNVETLLSDAVLAAQTAQTAWSDQNASRAANYCKEAMSAAGKALQRLTVIDELMGQEGLWAAEVDRALKR